jgi:natural product precursor
MKKKIKLSKISQKELQKNEMPYLLGGAPGACNTYCSCSCACNLGNQTQSDQNLQSTKSSKRDSGSIHDGLILLGTLGPIS